MGDADQIELIGSVQFRLPVARANAGLLPGEVVFQPHHIDAGGLVNRRLIRLGEEDRIILPARCRLPKRRRLPVMNLMLRVITVGCFRLLTVGRVRGSRRPLALRMSLLEWSGRAIEDRCRLVSRVILFCW